MTSFQAIYIGWSQALVSYIYIFIYYLRLSIKKGPYRFRVGCLSSRWKKNVLVFLNDLKFILYLKYDNFSTTWCMTRLPLLPIIYVRAHYIIQLEIHKNTSYFFGYTGPLLYAIVTFPGDSPCFWLTYIQTVAKSIRMLPTFPMYFI